MRSCPRSRLSWLLPAMLTGGLTVATGCAGAGKSPTGTGGSASPGSGGSANPGTAGSSSPGTAGASSPGTAGSSSPGTAGMSGVAGSIGPGSAGTTGSAGSGAPGTGGVSGGGTTGTAGSTATGTAGTSFAGTAGTGGGCQTAQYRFDPKIPIVYLLVDRSGSMFHCLTGATGDAVCATPANTAWSTLKEAVRSVVKPLEGSVQFGFATIWGTNPAGSPPGMCPSLQGMATDNVDPKLNNADSVMSTYDKLPFPPNSTQQGIKFESPASESIQVVAAALKANASQGDKYIIFITDGQPDYCDDANSLCAPDSVIGRIQEAKANGITTIVLGIQTPLFDLGMGILKAYATAGAGEPTVAPLRTATASINDFYDQCNGITGWHADMVALSKPNARGTTIGTYMTTAGPTTAYMPNATDQSMLVNQLSQALAGVKSCTFDLTDVGGKAIKVELSKLNQAHVKIEGTEIAQSTTNGWNVDAAAPSQLVLSGSACAMWRMPDKNNIEFQFPCGTIIFE